MLKELPEKPESWTKRMSVHLNYGDGGSALYTVHDADGTDTGIVYQYDTRKPKPKVEAVGKKKGSAAFEPAPTGFHVPSVDSDVYPSWKSLRAAWPDIAAKLESKNA